MYRIYKLKLHDQSRVVSTAERNNVESKHFYGQYVASIRRDTMFFVRVPRSTFFKCPVGYDILSPCISRYDVVQPVAEMQRCFAQPSIYRLAVHLKDEQYVYFKYGSEKK